MSFMPKELASFDTPFAWKLILSGEVSRRSTPCKKETYMW